MRLTTQMRAEMKTIRTRLAQIRALELSHLKRDYSLGGGKADSIINELFTYKVRLENILCETDNKEQDQIH